MLHFGPIQALGVHVCRLITAIKDDRTSRYLEVEFQWVKNELQFEYFFWSSNFRTLFNIPKLNYIEIFVGGLRSSERQACLRLCLVGLSCQPVFNG